MLNDADRAMLGAPNFASLATTMADGSPQASVVWIDVDDDTILVNTAEGRTKTENMRRDPRVAICLFDRTDPYRQLMVRGHVTGYEHDGADARIDYLAEEVHGRRRLRGPSSRPAAGHRAHRGRRRRPHGVLSTTSMTPSRGGRTMADPDPTANDATVKARWTRLATLGLVMVGLAAFLMIAASLIWGVDVADDLPFFLSLVIVPWVAAFLVWRFGTWAKVVGIVVGLASIGAMFWTAFGLAVPASFFDFVPGLLVVPGALIAIVASIGGIVANRRGHLTRTGDGGERRAITAVVAVVGVLAAISAVLTVVGRSTVDTRRRGDGRLGQLRVRPVRVRTCWWLAGGGPQRRSLPARSRSTSSKSTSSSDPTDRRWSTSRASRAPTSCIAAPTR